MQEQNLQNLFEEKQKIADMHRNLSYKHQKLKRAIKNTSFKLSMISQDVVRSGSSVSMLDLDYNIMKDELDKNIQEKEILVKDITILHHRLKRLENEIRKNQSWWQRIVPDMQ